MSNTPEQQERIETYGSQRIKFLGNRMVAIEQKCFYCCQVYWQPVISIMPATSQIGVAHQCSPDRQAGASVINKFG